MATHYIGNVPSHGEFKKADSIVSSFNGTLTQFDLDYDTVNQTVGDATQLIVSLNGIIQEPGTAYTLGIGGGSIVFASAPVSTDTCHIVLLGGVGGTTTPTDGSVTASKLDSGLKDYLEETFTADGTQTVFTLTRAAVGANTLLLTIDGIVQPSSAFTVSGTTLTISEVLAANTNVRVVHMGVKAGVYVPANDSITTDMLANSTEISISSKLPLAGGTMTGDLTVPNITATADMYITSTSPKLKLTDTDTAAEYTELQNSNGNTIIDTRNGTENGQFIIRGLGGGTVDEFGRFDESGRFGVGTSNPDHLLHVGNVLNSLGTTAGDSLSNLRIQSDTTHNDSLLFTAQRLADGTTWTSAAQRIQRRVDTTFMGYMEFGHKDIDLIKFGKNNTEYVRIDGNGNVGIGTTNPTEALTVSGIIKTIDGTDIDMDATASGQLMLDGNGYGGAIALNTQGMNIYTNSGSRGIIFGTDEIERVRIDSSGNLLVGTTSAYGTTGTTINAAGLVYSSADGDRAGQFDRTTSDGEIVRFSNGGATVGSIGVEGGDLVIGTGDTGIKTHDTVDAIVPYNTTTNSSRDASIDLGYPTNRFKDLYLSGGVYLGGIGAANKLDDYEEGSFGVTSTRNGVGEDTGGWRGRYAKIGNVVHVTISTNTYVRHLGSGYGNNQQFIITSNLPFTPASAGGSQVAHTRTLADPEKIALSWRTSSATIYLNQTGLSNSYEVSNNVVTGSTQTNITLNWSGTFYTSD